MHVGVKAGAEAVGPNGEQIMGTGQTGANAAASQTPGMPGDEIGSLSDATGALFGGAKAIFSGGMNR